MNNKEVLGLHKIYAIYAISARYHQTTEAEFLKGADTHSKHNPWGRSTGSSTLKTKYNQELLLLVTIKCIAVTRRQR